MNKHLAFLIGIFIITLIAGAVLILLPSGTVNAPTQNGTSSTTSGGGGSNIAGIPDLILVGTPTKGATISSPLSITGSARGNWYFEASFPIELKDANGTTIAQHYAEAQSDWMTTDFVIFKATLTFPPQPKGSTGTLILHKDNPSGEPQFDNSVSIPVIF